jgi:hypothetical protein
MTKRPFGGNPYGVVARRTKTSDTISHRVEKLIYDIRRKSMEQAAQEKPFDREAYGARVLDRMVRPVVFARDPDRTLARIREEIRRVKAEQKAYFEGAKP